MWPWRECLGVNLRNLFLCLFCFCGNVILFPSRGGGRGRDRFLFTAKTLWKRSCDDSVIAWPQRPPALRDPFWSFPKVISQDRFYCNYKWSSSHWGDSMMRSNITECWWQNTDFAAGLATNKSSLFLKIPQIQVSLFGTILLALLTSCEQGR